MQVGLNILGAENLYAGQIRPVLDLAAAADRAGIDMISTGDHLGFDAAAHAERVRTHNFPFPLDHDWYEPLSLLSSVAAVTDRALLNVSVLIATVRPPVLLAKQIATLDRISGGRAAIGMGVGWQEAEYTATNMPFDARFGRMEDTVRACRELWTRAPASFQGREYSFENFHARPFPVQDRVPVIFGFGPSQRNFDRIARVADGWTVNPADMRTFSESVTLLRETFEAHGRDPHSAVVQVSVGPERRDDGTVDLDATADKTRAWHAAGATVAVFRPATFCAAGEEVPELIEWAVGLKTAGADTAAARG
ncbi:TIGR03619 family F420-dependent LLM class oxidoreductase [Rhodococcus sp. SGAir0479]|uniref:TIGR03619 family F420-dependent LLM class oxidoreductase n=1 Tax=Rhodococcus sp. SGAir0479 TaxID=2567884 RepID=UPI0010CD4988|nr:TIGR03619 family F420-dependent LLM class oxidoreductase [Rhodococcus sp. SGAir0479]QCQ92782.1 TIGR03619 family F420-dependent LLM class oxidoreductase [Rhodococcus sp. SGAir0479]